MNRIAASLLLGSLLLGVGGGCRCLGHRDSCCCAGGPVTACGCGGCDSGVVDCGGHACGDSCCGGCTTDCCGSDPCCPQFSCHRFFEYLCAPLFAHHRSSCCAGCDGWGCEVFPKCGPCGSSCCETAWDECGCGASCGCSASCGCDNCATPADCCGGECCGGCQDHGCGLLGFHFHKLFDWCHGHGWGCGCVYHGDYENYPPCDEPCDCYGNHIGGSSECGCSGCSTVPQSVVEQEAAPSSIRTAARSTAGRAPARNISHRASGSSYRTSDSHPSRRW